MVGLAAKDKAPIVPGLKIKGDTIAGRYRVEKLLGAGSSGFVVAARHVYLRRRVTLKILTSTSSAHGRAQRRHLAIAHQAAALRGLHVARIVDTGYTEDGTPFVATERLEGRTVAEELAACSRVPAAIAVRWIMQACEGLAEAHSAGIVHGDLKPQNLFLAGEPTAATGDGHGFDARILKILDFGMASPVEDEAGESGTGAWFASPAYLAPEQIRDPHAVDGRADVWALGVIIHEMIAGTLPFSADTVAGMLVAVAYDEPALLAAEDVPFELARVVQACLSKDPAARPPDVATLARALSPFAGAEGIGLARRVEAALSTPPPMAMAMPMPGAEDTPGSEDADLAPPRLAPAHEDAAGGGAAHAQPAAARVDVAGTLALGREDPAYRRRRAGAIAMVGAAAVLALVGFFAPSSPGAAELESHRTAAEQAPPPPRPAEGLALPFVPPSSTANDEPEAANEPPPPSAPNPTAAPPSQRPVPAASAASPVSKRPAAKGAKGTPAARSLAKDLPNRKVRSSLAVRENPYDRGFTHPTRLSDRSKK